MLKLTNIFVFFALLAICKSDLHEGGILAPKASETRQLLSLDGVWNFVLGNTTNLRQGFVEKWYKKSLTKVKGNLNVRLMPVPASYNDIGTDSELRDHVGVVWYQKNFFVPPKWNQEGRVWLRFGSVSYSAQVWINGHLVMNHQIGHLPFLAEVTSYLRFEEENQITVACDNTLLSDTIPQGYLNQLESGRIDQSYTFDFFNYAGIDRPVHLYTTPTTYIDDVDVEVTLDSSSAFLNFNISVLGDGQVIPRVLLEDADEIEVGREDSFIGTIQVEAPRLWWPYLMNEDVAYLYTLKIELRDDQNKLLDIYRLPVGLRVVSWTDSQLLINNKPVYLHGFGRHEDSDIRGKGLDWPLVIRDHNLIKWIGANAYRTSHYPYAEELMDMADSMGIMIIDECPAVNIELFSDRLLEHHKQSLTELIRRDKNRPSVIMWSAANEPRTQREEAGEYFRKVIEHIKSLDTSRPNTIVENQGPTITSSKYVDIISMNHYSAWYSNYGQLDIIKDEVIDRATQFRKSFGKPVLISEYGADTLEGLHFLPDFIWSEEFQTSLMSEHFKAFDELRKQGWFIGEFIWNFADFKTAQDYKRVGGNKKGLFTRNRQPKNSAFHMRRRYWGLAKEYNNVTLPDDLQGYVISSDSCSRKRNEL